MTRYLRREDHLRWWMVVRTKEDDDMYKLENIYIRSFCWNENSMYKGIVSRQTMFLDMGLFLFLPATTLDSGEKTRNSTSIKLYNLVSTLIFLFLLCKSFPLDTWEKHLQTCYIREKYSCLLHEVFFTLVLFSTVSFVLLITLAFSPAEFRRLPRLSTRFSPLCSTRTDSEA